MLNNIAPALLPKKPFGTPSNLQNYGKFTTKQPSKLQSNYLQMDIQVPHFATSITSAARGSIFAACVINYCYSD